MAGFSNDMHPPLRPTIVITLWLEVDDLKIYSEALQKRKAIRFQFIMSSVAQIEAHAPWEKIVRQIIAFQIITIYLHLLFRYGN